MPTTVLAQPGEGYGPLTLKLYDPADITGGPVNGVGGDTAAEDPVAYSFSVAEALSGLYLARLEDSGGGLIATGGVLFDGRGVVGIGDYEQLAQLSRVPRTGKTTRHRQVAIDTTAKTADVALEDVP